MLWMFDFVVAGLGRKRQNTVKKIKKTRGKVAAAVKKAAGKTWARNEIPDGMA